MLYTSLFMLIFTPKFNTCLEYQKATRLKVVLHFLVLISKQLYVFIMKPLIELVANDIKRVKNESYICKLRNCYT